MVPQRTYSSNILFGLINYSMFLFYSSLPAKLYFSGSGFQIPLNGLTFIASSNCRIRFKIIVLPLFFQYSRSVKALEVNFKLPYIIQIYICCFTIFCLLNGSFQMCGVGEGKIVNTLFSLSPLPRYILHVKHLKINGSRFPDPLTMSL